MLPRADLLKERMQRGGCVRMSVMQFAHYIIPFPETIPSPICQKDFLRIGGIELQFEIIEIEDD